jgi:hypothetical protein
MDMSYLLRWLREAGILICTVSLLFLPWFYDTFPFPDLSPVVMGTEFLVVRSPVVIGGFISLWLAYLLSRFAPYKWPAALLFFVGFLLYHWVYVALVLIGGRWDPYGIPLGRFGFYQDKNFELLIGGWSNIVGVLLLFAGLFLAERKHNGKIFILGSSGAILGWVLYWGSIIVFHNIFKSPIYEIVLWVGLPVFPILGGVIAFSLARKYLIHNELPLSA